MTSFTIGQVAFSVESILRVIIHSRIRIEFFSLIIKHIFRTLFFFCLNDFFSSFTLGYSYIRFNTDVSYYTSQVLLFSQLVAN